MEINDYMSIPILPGISKLFEKIMYERFCSFFDKKNMYYSEQFGFRSERSNINALAEVTEQIRQGSTDTFTCILLDLREALDSIFHEIILTKLEKYGVRGNPSNWFV